MVSTETAFVLISTKARAMEEVYNIISEMTPVREVHEVNSNPDYSIIAKVEGDSLKTIGEFVVNHIRTIQGVVETKTLVSFKGGL